MIDAERSVVTAAVFRFSPQTQTIKQQAIDKIIENVIFNSSGSIGVDQISERLGGNGVGIHIAPAELSSSIDRLLDKDRLVRLDGGASVELTAVAAAEIHNERGHVIARQTDIVNELTSGNANDFLDPFLTVLAEIFATIGDNNASMVIGEGNSIETPSNLELTCERVAEEAGVNAQTLLSATVDFFQSEDVRFAEMKWQFTQSFFVCRAVGLEGGDKVLSEDAFTHATIYLDTNVVIDALEPSSRLFNSINLIFKSSKNLNIRFMVCHITLEEIGRILTAKFEDAKKVIGYVPDDTLYEADSLIAKIYMRQRREGTFSDVRGLFANFDVPSDQLRDRYQVELDDGPWFENNIRDPKTSRVRNEVQNVAKRMKRNEKKWTPANHDALLLRRAVYRRQSGEGNAWILTADTSLPGVKSADVGGKSVAVTVDAMLSWLSPVLSVDEVGPDFISAFSSIVAEKVLPQKLYLGISDFAIFNDLNISVREMPADDVSKCMKYIKSTVSDLDLTTAEDREKMSYEITRFMADPDRRYKKKLESLESKLDNLSLINSKLSDKNSDLIQENNATNAHLTGSLSAITELNERLEGVEVRLRQSRQDAIAVRKGWIIFGLLSFVWIISALSLVSLSIMFGDQNLNNLARVVDWIEVHVAVLSIIPIVGFFIIGKPRWNKMLSALWDSGTE